MLLQAPLVCFESKDEEFDEAGVLVVAVRSSLPLSLSLMVRSLFVEVIREEPPLTIDGHKVEVEVVTVAAVESETLPAVE